MNRFRSDVRFFEYPHPDGRLLVDIKKHEILGRILRRSRNPHGFRGWRPPEGVERFNEKEEGLLWIVKVSEKKPAWQKDYDASELKKTLLENPDLLLSPPPASLPGGLLHALDTLRMRIARSARSAESRRNNPDKGAWRVVFPRKPKKPPSTSSE